MPPKTTTYHSTRPPPRRGHPRQTLVSAHRAEASAQVCWLRVVHPSPDRVQVIYLDHATALALWTELGPIIRDQRTELAVLEALAEDDRARGPA